MYPQIETNYGPFGISVHGAELKHVASKPRELSCVVNTAVKNNKTIQEKKQKEEGLKTPQEEVKERRGRWCIEFSSEMTEGQ